MFTDFILNGQGHGEVGTALGQYRFDPGLRRIYIGDDGHDTVTVNTGRRQWDDKKAQMVPIYEEVRVRDLRDAGVPVLNATPMRKDDYIRFDRRVVEIARENMRAWSDLAAKNRVGGFDGMSKLMIEHETVNDPGEAVVDMYGTSMARNFETRYQLEGIPLPITHAQFQIEERKLIISRASGTPLSTVNAERAARRVAESIEQTLIGTRTGLIYGASSEYSRTAQVYGYTNYPDRVTKTDMNAPTGSNGDVIVADFLELREAMYAANFKGPFMVYTSTDWDQFLDTDFKDESEQTLRQRLKSIEGIQDIRRLDFLRSSTNPFTVLMIQMTSDVAEAVVGMDITTMQWESFGGMMQNFRVLAIMVPRLFSDQEGNCGIGHGTIS